MRKIIVTVLTLLTFTALSVGKTQLRNQGNAVQLIVDGKPFIVLGGELGN
jgi:hypothetical protein